jgi:hypothetical protein
MRNEVFEREHPFLDRPQSLPFKIDSSIDGEKTLALFSLFHSFLKLEQYSDCLQRLYVFLRDSGREEDAEFTKRLINASQLNRQRTMDSISRGQIVSKLWLIQESKQFIESIPDKLCFILAGWNGILAYLFFRIMPSAGFVFRCFDRDPYCESIADEINRPFVMNAWRFKAATLDILNINLSAPYFCFCPLKEKTADMRLLYEKPNIIINTSCEHIEDFSRWWDQMPDKTLTILQSNDSFGEPDHVNCHKNLDDFIASAPMKTIHYKGEIDLGKYRRFMLIGEK